MILNIWSGTIPFSDLDEKSFNEEFEKIYEEYKKRMESQMDIEEIKEKRFQFLHSVYNLSNADENIDIQSYQLGKNLGFSDNFTSKVIPNFDSC